MWLLLVVFVCDGVGVFVYEEIKVCVFVGLQDVVDIYFGIVVGVMWRFRFLSGVVGFQFGFID